MSRKDVPAGKRIDQWKTWLSRLSRGRRVALSLAITLELVIVVSLIVDRLLVDQVVEGDLSRTVPAWITVGAGLILYAIGWWTLVGFDWEVDQPWQAGTPAVLYVGAGVASLLVLGVLILLGLAFGYIL